MAARGEEPAATHPTSESRRREGARRVRRRRGERLGESRVRRRVGERVGGGVKRGAKVNFSSLISCSRPNFLPQLQN